MSFTTKIIFIITYVFSKLANAIPEHFAAIIQKLFIFYILLFTLAPAYDKIDLP